MDQHPRQESVVPILFIIRSNCLCLAFVQVLSSHLVNRAVFFKTSAELVFSTREDEVANKQSTRGPNSLVYGNFFLYLHRLYLAELQYKLVMLKRAMWIYLGCLWLG